MSTVGVRFVGGPKDGHVQRIDPGDLASVNGDMNYGRADWADRYFRDRSVVYILRGYELRVDSVAHHVQERASRQDAEAAWAMLYSEYSASLAHRAAVLHAHPVQSEARGNLRLSWLVKP